MLGAAVVGFSRVLTRDVPRVATGVVREAGWLTAHAVMYPFGLLAPGPDRAGRRHDLRGLSAEQRGLLHLDLDAAGTPILLVHGIVDNHSIFTLLERALHRRGFSNLSWFDYRLLTRDVREAAADFAVAVEAVVERSGYDKVHVIGHSLGGLIARYYVQRLGGDARVHTLITLGTPHQGTRWAHVGRLWPLVRQLRPGSTLLRELAEPAPGLDTRFVAFHSDLDQLIIPSRYARIEHPDLDARNVAIRGLGHMSLPNDGRIAFAIANVLSRLDDGHDFDEAVTEPGDDPYPGDCDDEETKRVV